MGETLEKIIKIIKETPLYILFLIGSFLIVNLFIFISIFLFHKTFYNNNAIGIIFTFTFALSFIWYSILSITVLIQTNEKINNDPEFDINQLSFVNSFTSIFLLTLFVSIFYFLNNICRYNYHFHIVLYWLFGIVLVSLIFQLLVVLVRNIKKLIKLKQSRNKPNEEHIL